MKRLPLLLLPVLCVLTLLWGSVDIPPAAVWHALVDDGAAGEMQRYIVLHLRLPAMATTLLAGSALAAAGLVMQTVFGNPLADPSLLGVNAGAGLGAAVAMLLLGSSATAGAVTLSGHLLTMVAACLGAGAVIALLLFFSARFHDPLRLLVAGVMVSCAAAALITVLSYFASADGLQNYVVWGMGHVTGLSGDTLALLAAVVGGGLTLLLGCTKGLNALLLGADYATNLGFRVRPLRTTLLTLAALLAAVVTALCGPLSFIGLAAPHIARFLHRTADHRRLLPLSLLWGADIALLAALGTHLPHGVTLPLNALTPLFGIPVVLALLLRPRG